MRRRIDVLFHADNMAARCVFMRKTAFDLVSSAVCLPKFVTASCSAGFTTSTTCYKIRVPSTYDIFRKAEFKKVQSEHPDMDKGTVFGELARIWKAGGEDVKQRYEEQHEFYKQNSHMGGKTNKPFDFFVRHEQKHRPEDISLEAYKSELLDRWQGMSDAEKFPFQLLSTLKKRAERRKKQSTRKKNINPFNLYIRKNISQVKDKNPNLTQQKVFAETTKGWYALSEEEKNSYVEEAKELNKKAAAEYERAVQRGNVAPPPVRKLTSYNIFVRENMKNRPREIGTTAYMSELGRDWKVMGEKDKARYAPPVNQTSEPIATNKTNVAAKKSRASSTTTAKAPKEATKKDATKAKTTRKKTAAKKTTSSEDQQSENEDKQSTG